MDHKKNNNFKEYNVADDEIDLSEILAVIWQGKWVIIVTTLLCSVLTVFFAIKQPNVYVSEALLTSADHKQSSSLTNQFGSLANLAGISLGGASDNKTQLAMKVLKSRQFTSYFIEKHNILADLMAAKSWNIVDNKIHYDNDIYIKNEDEWVRNVTFPLTKKPSMQEAFRKFSQILTVSLDQESGMITISVEHISPFIAKQWVSWLVEDINQEMKARDVDEANRSTKFLTSQLEKTKVADIRSILYKLVEEQAKTIMLANVREEYVFKTIDPALVPDIKSKPKRAIICLIGFILSFFVSIMFVLARYFTKKNITKTELHN